MENSFLFAELPSSPFGMAGCSVQRVCVIPFLHFFFFVHCGESLTASLDRPPSVLFSLYVCGCASTGQDSRGQLGGGWFEDLGMDRESG